MAASSSSSKTPKKAFGLKSYAERRKGREKGKGRGGMVGGASGYDHLGTSAVAITFKTGGKSHMEAQMEYGDPEGTDLALKFFMTSPGIILGSNLRGIGRPQDTADDSPTDRKLYLDILFGAYEDDEEDGRIRVKGIIPQRHIDEWERHNPNKREGDGERTLSWETSNFFKKFRRAVTVCFEGMLKHSQVQVSRSVDARNKARKKNKAHLKAMGLVDDDEIDEYLREEYVSKFMEDGSAHAPYDAQLSEATLISALTNTAIQDILYEGSMPDATMDAIHDEARRRAQALIIEDEDDDDDEDDEGEREKKDGIMLSKLALARVVIRCWRPPKTIGFGPDSSTQLQREKAKWKTEMAEIRATLQDQNKELAEWEITEMADKIIYAKLRAASWKYTGVELLGKSGEPTWSRHEDREEKIWERDERLDPGAIIQIKGWLAPYSQKNNGHFGVRMMCSGDSIRLCYPAIYHHHEKTQGMRRISFGVSATEWEEEKTRVTAKATPSASAAASSAAASSDDEESHSYYDPKTKHAVKSKTVYASDDSGAEDEDDDSGEDFADMAAAMAASRKKRDRSDGKKKIGRAVADYSKLSKRQRRLTASP